MFTDKLVVERGAHCVQLCSGEPLPVSSTSVVTGHCLFVVGGSGGRCDIPTICGCMCSCILDIWRPILVVLPLFLSTSFFETESH